MKQINHKEVKEHRILSFLLSLFAAFCTGVFLLGDRDAEVSCALDMIQAMNGVSMGALSILGLLTLWYCRVWRIRDRRAAGFAALGGAVFAILNFFGYPIYFHDTLIRENLNLFSLALELCCLLGTFFLFFSILLAIFSYVNSRKITPVRKAWADRYLGCSWPSFWVCFGLLMAVSILLQIYFYPGITNVDSFVQISESMGLSPLTDRHPFLHTLMMRSVIGLGVKLFGTIGEGLILYTFFQSVMMSLAISFAQLYLAKRNIHPAIRLACLLYFLLHPAIGCYNITLWKDIWLSYFLMLYVLLLIEASLNTENFFRRNSHMVGLLLVILGFLFSKNTGIIVLVITLPFLFIAARKHFRKLAVVALIALSLLGLVRLAVIPAMHVRKGEVSEPFSVPLQQIGRTVLHEKDSLTEEQRSTINEILPLDQIPDLYQPYLSDNMKGLLNVEAFSQDPMRYVRCWLDVGLHHPRMYLESFLANSCGYWYPDVVYWVLEPTWYFTSGEFMAEIGDPDPDMETYQVNMDHGLRRNFAAHLYILLQAVPGISSLISVAFPFWAEFALMLICLMKKKYRMLLPMLVILATWLICIFSPVIAEYRYAFPAVVCLPLLTAFTLQDDLQLTESMTISRKSGK